MSRPGPPVAGGRTRLLDNARTVVRRRAWRHRRGELGRILGPSIGGLRFRSHDARCERLSCSFRRRHDDGRSPVTGGDDYWGRVPGGPIGPKRRRGISIGEGGKSIDVTRRVPPARGTSETGCPRPFDRAPGGGSTGVLTGNRRVELPRVAGGGRAGRFAVLLLCLVCGASGCRSTNGVKRSIRLFPCGEKFRGSVWRPDTGTRRTSTTTTTSTTMHLQHLLLLPHSNSRREAPSSTSRVSDQRGSWVRPLVEPHRNVDEWEVRTASGWTAQPPPTAGPKRPNLSRPLGPGRTRARTGPILGSGSRSSKKPPAGTHHPPPDQGLLAASLSLVKTDA